MVSTAEGQRGLSVCKVFLNLCGGNWDDPCTVLFYALQAPPNHRALVLPREHTVLAPGVASHTCVPDDRQHLPAVHSETEVVQARGAGLPGASAGQLELSQLLEPGGL